ncbi:adenylate/guanylate cyclase domain-containing protein [Myxococcota bacterium]
MRIARKYPAFLLLTTLLTAVGVFAALLNEMRNSIEREVKEDGEATVESFAATNAWLLLMYPSDPEKAQSRLQFNLLQVAKRPDVVNARLADNRGVIIASLIESEWKEKSRLPAFFAKPDADPISYDTRLHAYNFHAKVRFADDILGTFVLTVSLTPLEAAMERATVRAMVFASGIAAIMCIFALLLVRREIRPVKIMRIALSEIAKGDFSQRVPVERNDEIGELSTALNRMLKRSELFFHYVDKMIIERLVADDSLSNPGGREQDLAVIFGDMRGYTTMSNRRTADEVVHIVNTYFYLFIECIAHWGGIVDKTMGDAIMAVFEHRDDDGAKDNKQRGVLALAYMKAASRVLNRFLQIRIATGQTLTVEPREFGFAMATGRAIVGNVGSRRRMDYTVSGRVVNLAARLEGLTKNGEVIIDTFTRVGTSDLIHSEPLPPVQPKGFSESEKVVPHRVTGLSDGETHKLRIFLKKLFGYSFLSEMVMPKNLAVGEQQPWCREAEVLLIKILAETPVTDFFARADVTTSKLLADEDDRIKPPDRRADTRD